MNELAMRCQSLSDASPLTSWIALQGPTGEANLYATRPRGAVLCVATSHASGGMERDLLQSLAAALAVGSRAVWLAQPQAEALAARLPVMVRERLLMAEDPMDPAVSFDAAVCHGGPETLIATAQALATRPGPIVTLIGLPPGDTRIPLERLVIERSLSINTAAAGGNASLMTIG
jgi:RHH-type proline utilization regulon transcriptional repressor/proline dehydrogenase/delta 1-pyrroline-5-carboxylate dehydrogenase